MMKKDFLTLSDFTPSELMAILKRALALKKQKTHKPTLKGKVLGLIFEKSSTRTRVSFEAAMIRLGGQAITLESHVTQLGRGETYEDTARVLSRYLNGIVLRTYSQESIENLARYSSVPVINGLTDLSHPCQIMADLMTVLEVKKNIDKQKIVYVGDGNNMANTWIEAAHLLKFRLALACPKKYYPEYLSLVKNNIVVTTDPIEAVTDADVVNTDTWFSMGQKVSNAKRKIFAPYQVNKKLMGHARKDAIVLHCLPAHRGEEITDEVMDGPQSRVWIEAENRMFVQMAILEKLL